MGSINIYFDYGGHYTTSEDSVEWHREGGSYGISFRTTSPGEITYSDIVARIYKKVGADESKTKLRLSFTPLVVLPHIKTDVCDDDDVYLYLTSMDSERRRSVLHVEVINEMVPMAEHVSGVNRRSSHGGNYEELNEVGGENVEASHGVVSIYAGKEGRIENRESNDSEDEQNSTSYTNLLENAIIRVGEDQSRDDINTDLDNAIDHGLENDGIHDHLEQIGAEEASRSVEAWEDGLNLEVGQEFESKQAVKDLVERGMHENCFGATLRNSDTNRYVLKCREAKRGCKWALRVTRVKNSVAFTVRTYNKVHTCSRTSSSGSTRKRGTPRLVASILKEDYPGKFETPTPKSLIGLIQGRVGVEVSYSTARRGKKLAINDVRGTPEEGYQNLPSYLYMLEKVNPGTKTSLLLDEEKRFKYLFVALGPSIEGFKAMRKVIIVDATFLKTVYGGVLIVATAQDPNHHHYPIAFAIVDGEKDASWRWFFNTLKTVIPDSRELVFISDRNASLIKAVGEVYPDSQHGYCIFHISQNVRTKVAPEFKEEAGKKFREIGSIYTEDEFLRAYSEYRSRFPNVAKYLDESVAVDKWARCYFPGQRYNINTTNEAESMNAIFVKERKYPILNLLDAIIAKMSKWFNLHRKDASAIPNERQLVPFVENELHGRCAVATKLQVTELNSFELVYSVIGRDGMTYGVDLRHKTCTCKCFDIDKYPCVHAIASVYKFVKQDIRPTDMKDLYDLCSPYYLVSTWALAYTMTLYPVPDNKKWIVPKDIRDLHALPPKHLKKKRKSSRD